MNLESENQYWCNFEPIPTVFTITGNQQNAIAAITVVELLNIEYLGTTQTNQASKTNSMLVSFTQKTGYPQIKMQNPTPEQQVLLRQLYKDGVPLADMAKHPDIRRCTDTVRDWLLEMSLCLRTRQRKGRTAHTGYVRGAGIAIPPARLAHTAQQEEEDRVSINQRLKQDGYYG